MTRLPLRSRVLFLSIVCCLFPLNASAETGRDRDDKPVLLILKVGSSPSDRGHEERFIAELGVILDTYLIKTADKTAAEALTDFSKQPLKQRLAEIKALARSQKAAATIWLETGASDNTLLYLVAVSSGRLLIRVLEADEGPNSEVTLATAVEEIVGRAYLFNAENPGAALETPPTSTVVDTQKEDPPPCKPTVPPDSASSGMFVQGVGRVGLAGLHGPRFSGGGKMGISYNIHRWVSLSGGADIIAGPFEETDEQRIRNLSVEPFIGVDLSRRRHHFSFGGGLFVAVPWQQTIVTLPSTGDHVYHDWNIRFSFRFNLTIHVGDLVAVAVSPDLGVWLDQTRYFSAATDRDILVNPRLDGGLLIGVILKN